MVTTGHVTFKYVSFKSNTIRTETGYSVQFAVGECTLVQVLRLCTGRRAHRGSRGIALL